MRKHFESDIYKDSDIIRSCVVPLQWIQTIKVQSGTKLNVGFMLWFTLKISESLIMCSLLLYNVSTTTTVLLTRRTNTPGCRRVQSTYVASFPGFRLFDCIKEKGKHSLLGTDMHSDLSYIQCPGLVAHLTLNPLNFQCKIRKT